MIPGMNSRQAQQMMRKMGIQQQELDDAEQVIIRCKDRHIIIDSPQVSKVNMMGQETYQVVGESREEALSQDIEVSDEDIETVKEQTGVSADQARDAIEEAKGDLAEAILNLSSK